MPTVTCSSIAAHERFTGVYILSFNKDKRYFRCKIHWAELEVLLGLRKRMRSDSLRESLFPEFLDSIFIGLCIDG